MSETKSVLAVRSTSFLFGVDECLEIVDVAVSICKMFYWEVSTPISRGCFKGSGHTDRRFLSQNPVFSDLLLFRKPEGKSLV